MKTKMNMNFTKTTLLELENPSKGKIRVYDTKEKGLGLYVTFSGHKSFFIKKRVHGQQKDIIIGPFPEMTVELARKAAQKIKLEIITGQDPTEKKEKAANEKTFGEAFQMFMERHARIENKTWKEIEGIINKFLSHWFQRKLSSIAKSEVQALHDCVCRENGKYRANKVLAWFSAIHHKMIGWGWEGSNPAADIKKFKE
jgi:hypothetical protein